MKKINKIILSLLMIFSMFMPCFGNTRVYAMARNFTFAYIDATDLSVRSCPSSNTNECPRLVDREGDTIWLNRPRTVEVVGYSGDWAKIQFDYWGYTYVGYVYNYYLGSIKNYTLDTNYANELRRKGFPESYIEKLCKMHAVHPSWNFEVVSGLDSLEEAVNGEYTPISKNLVQTTDLFMRSTDPEAYVNGTYVQFEPGWYAASRGALKYYLDPRNFLDDNSIFMFEQLSYNNNVNESVIQKMLDGSFMAGEFIYNNEVYSYARALNEAGKIKNVNPVHLAARILQEQGISGSATANMDGGNGKTYHNYFNFGASGLTGNDIYNGALNYAKASGWDNPYKAILGAAEDISDGYISGGQDTIYLQKFNVNGTLCRYGYQYMANIQAPYSESYRTYRSYYDTSLVNLAFTFKIPVFNGMNDNTVMPTLSSNNNLNSLNVSNYELSPSFDSGITTYNIVVGAFVNSVEISGSIDEKAKVSGFGTISLNEQKTNHTITVTAEDGSKKDYKITIIKEEIRDDSIDDIVLSEGFKLNNDNIVGFTIGEDVSSYIEKFKNDFSDITITMFDSEEKEIKKGLIATGQRLVIKKGEDEKKYYVSIKGDANGDGKISISDYARVKAIIQNKYVAQGYNFIAADANGDGKISISDYAKIKAKITNNVDINQ